VTIAILNHFFFRLHPGISAGISGGIIGALSVMFMKKFPKENADKKE